MDDPCLWTTRACAGEVVFSSADLRVHSLQCVPGPRARPHLSCAGRHQWAVTGLAWLGREVLLSASMDGTVRVWNTDACLQYTASWQMLGNFPLLLVLHCASPHSCLGHQARRS